MLRERGALVHVGHKQQRTLLAVSHTYTGAGPANARVRIISAREATRNERRQYENEPHRAAAR
jgi:uncharacterized DUF497 family protein